MGKVNTVNIKDKIVPEKEDELWAEFNNYLNGNEKLVEIAKKNNWGQLQIERVTQISDTYGINEIKVANFVVKNGVYTTLMVAKFYNMFQKQFPDYLITIDKIYACFKIMKDKLIHQEYSTLNQLERAVIRDTRLFDKVGRPSYVPTYLEIRNDPHLGGKVELDESSKKSGAPSEYAKLFTKGIREEQLENVLGQDPENLVELRLQNFELGVNMVEIDESIRKKFNLKGTEVIGKVNIYKPLGKIPIGKLDDLGLSVISEEELKKRG